MQQRAEGRERDDREVRRERCDEALGRPHSVEQADEGVGDGEDRRGETHPHFELFPLSSAVVFKALRHARICPLSGAVKF